MLRDRPTPDLLRRFRSVAYSYRYMLFISSVIFLPCIFPVFFPVSTCSCFFLLSKVEHGRTQLLSLSRTRDGTFVSFIVRRYGCSLFVNAPRQCLSHVDAWFSFSLFMLSTLLKSRKCFSTSFSREERDCLCTARYCYQQLASSFSDRSLFPLARSLQPFAIDSFQPPILLPTSVYFSYFLATGFPPSLYFLSHRKYDLDRTISAPPIPCW